MPQRVFVDPPFSKVTDPHNRLVFAGILWIDRLIGVGGRQYGGVRRNHGVLVQLIVSVVEFSRHSGHDGMTRVSDRHGEYMSTAMVSLLPPPASDNAFKLPIELGSARERRRGVVIDDQSLAA